MILVLFFQTLPPVCSAQEEWNINVIVVKEDFRFDYLNSDVSPVLKNNHTLVPLRALADMYGFNVSWEENTRSVILSKEDKSIKMNIGSAKVIVDGKEEFMPTEATIIKNRTFVPLRYACEYLGLNVLWVQNEENVGYVWISPLCF